MATLELENIKTKLTILEAINENPQISNRDLGKVFNVKPSKVSAVRIWSDRKGYAEYKQHLTNKLNEVQNEMDGAIELYAKLSNDFKNVVGKGKIEARKLMANAIKNSKENDKLNGGIIATLPSNTWGVEEIIYNEISKKFKYLACERENGVFIDMVKKMNNYGKHNKPYFGSLSDVIFNSKENDFDHIIADYCGVLSTFKDELIHAVINNVVKVGGTISVTTLKARNDNGFVNRLNSFHNELCDDSVELNNNENAIMMFFKSLCAISNFEIVEEFCYCDSTPMMLVVLKRVK